jgi:hypothetical protein
MTSNDPRRRPTKKRGRKKKSGSPILFSEIVSGLRHQMDRRWPNLGRRLASVIRVSREKLDDVYCSAAQFVTEHKEAFDDRLAEKKAHARTAEPAERQRGASVHPIRRARRDTEKKGAATRSLRPSPVKKPKEFQRNRLPET